MTNYFPIVIDYYYEPEPLLEFSGAGKKLIGKMSSIYQRIVFCFVSESHCLMLPSHGIEKFLLPYFEVVMSLLHSNALLLETIEIIEDMPGSLLPIYWGNLIKAKMQNMWQYIFLYFIMYVILYSVIHFIAYRCTCDMICYCMCIIYVIYRDGNSSQRLGLESHLSRINKDLRLDLDS